MKKTKIWLIIALAALIVCGALAVNVYAGRVSGTETAAVSVSEGMTLHVDTALRSGTVRFQVTNAAQTTVEDMELTQEFAEEFINNYDNDFPAAEEYKNDYQD